MQDKKINKNEIEDALNKIKEQKEVAGKIPVSGKKILIEGGIKDFSGMTLKRTKGVIKEGVYYSCKAGTVWEDIDLFSKKNIAFSESDFNN